MVICQLLDDPGDGQVTLEGVSVGSEAVYSCDVGFQLIGESRRTCLLSRRGAWSGTEPSCQSKVLSTPIKVFHTYVSVQLDESPLLRLIGCMKWGKLHAKPFFL